MPNSRGALWQSSYVPESLSVLDHPLAPRTKSALKTQTIINEVQSVDDFADFADPLGVHDTQKLEPIVLASNEKPKVSNSLTDGPLSNTLLENLSVDQKDEDPEFIGFKPWRDYRLQILDEFHSKDLLCLETSFLKTTTTKHVRKKRPNEQAASIGVFHDLAEEDYKRRLNELSRVLHQLWEEERRLECIKLCREVSALLSSPQSPRFYPQKFVLVTDFLETFGRLVFDRLRSKANEERIKNGLDPLPSQFSTTDILEKTRITARNWFGKVSEINDVVQRIYVGACLMPCMKFMDNSAISDNLMRLCVLACSLQHPLTSAYARCYICRISMRLMPDNRAPHWKCINDWIQNFQQQPMVLLWPALEYVIQCVAYGAMTFDDLLPLWEYCKLQDKRPFMLKSMFNALPPLYLAEHSLAACKILTSSEHINCKEICSFGEALLNKSVTIFEQNRRIILKAVWKSIKTMTNLKSFLSCCEVWAEFAARYFGIDHVHFILDTVVERLTPERRFEQYLDVLASMASRIVRSVKNVAELVDAEVFPRFFQLFTDRDSACQLSTVILSGIVSKHPAAALNDTTLAYQIVDMCKCVHDVLNIHSASEKVASSEQLICRALDRFDLQEVPEQNLSFFVAARAALLSLDECQRYITGRILELSLFVVRSARFSSARSAFVQACVANAYITIPSLPDPSTRIQLFIQSAELALAGMAFLQASCKF
ncbi:hypothetical protein M3Y97_00571100 [Aphelenchoides bicaudatus]|nr:hypothetical protein M3Y97_00571100 [Aphelenchoides bicaudatus]